MNFLKRFRFVFIFGVIISIIIGLVLAIYLWAIPYLVASKRVHNFVDKKLNEAMGIHMLSKNLKLVTGFPYITFSADEFSLSKGGKYLINLKMVDTKFSVAKVRFKRIDVKRLGADYIFVDVNKVLDIIPKEEKKETKPFDWYIDFIQSELYVNKLVLLYKVNGIDFSVDTKDIKIDTDKTDIIPVHFDLKANIKQKNKGVRVIFKDNNKVYIKDKQLHIDKNFIFFNKSKLNIQGRVKDDKDFGINVSARDFDISNVVALIESNMVIQNGAEMLTYFDNIDGDFDFDFGLNPKGINGKIKIHHLCFLLVPIENVPVHIHNGNIIVDTRNIYLKNFSGYYGTRPVNTLKFEGRVKDYMKTFNTHIVADGVVADDFAKYYLTPTIGIPINIVGKADTRLKIDFVNNIINLKWFFKVSPEDNLLVSGEPVSKYKEERVIISDMAVEGLLLKIKNLNYYVTVPGVKDFYRRKLISLHGLIDFSKGVDFRVMGFKIEKPVPSAFLNIIARHEIFKDGTAVGNLTAVDGPKGVKLFGNLELDKIKIPDLRVYLSHAKLDTNFDTINISADGEYRRAKYTLSGNIHNNIGFPVIVNNLEFGLDSIDVEKMLTTLNQSGNNATQPQESVSSPVKDDDSASDFDLSNLIIKDCKLKLGKAFYKDLIAENMEAKLSLDEKSDLELDSNRFEFAKGHSSAHVCCDFLNHNYHLKLGVKDVDSNLIATTLLNLPKEISGKSSGIINLHTDDTLKLNGGIKFIIKKGTIGKIGLIEYVLNVASVFRNPLAMINPMIVFDLINVPNGEFSKIQGTLDIKNNVIESLKIKSFAPYLSAYIVGNYNLEKSDASLRIYTKMTNKKKGIYGFLRGISLSNLASRVSTGARNDVYYYSSEISELPEIDADEKDCQIFMTTVDGDVEHFNFLSSLRKLK